MRFTAVFRLNSLVQFFNSEIIFPSQFSFEIIWLLKQIFMLHQYEHFHHVIFKIYFFEFEIFRFLAIWALYEKPVFLGYISVHVLVPLFLLTVIDAILAILV